MTVSPGLSRGIPFCLSKKRPLFRRYFFERLALPKAGLLRIYSLIFLGFLQNPHLNFQHPAVLHTRYRDIQALSLEVVPGLGDPAHLLQHPAGDGGGAAVGGGDRFGAVSRE